MHKTFPTYFVFLDRYDSQIFKNNNTNMGVIYRNYNADKRGNELIKIANACKAHRNQLFVSNDIKLAIKVKAEGIYIPSFNKTKRFSKIISGAFNSNISPQINCLRGTSLYLFPK